MEHRTSSTPTRDRRPPPASSDDLVAVARAGIGNYFAFYKGRRPHTALDRNTPDNVYFESQPLAVAA